MSGWIGSWRFALRIARRQLLRAKARNALIAAMLALPVFGTVGVETVLHSVSHLSVAEQITRRVGGFDAFVQRGGGSVIQQTPDAQSWYAQGARAQSPTGVAGVQSVLPQATLTPELESGSVDYGAAGRYATGAYLQMDLANPHLAGVLDLVSGRLPQTSGEIDLSPSLAADLGVGVGRQVTLLPESVPDGAAARFTVVGLIELPNATRSEDAFALPSAPAAIKEAPAGWFVTNPGGVTWDQLEALNAHGFPVVSRSVLLDPPAGSGVPFSAPDFPGPDSALPFALQHAVVPAAVTGIAVGIALLEVVLLAGPGFAVSVRRREREYAMLAAAGADGRQLRRIVLADGLVLGAIAGVVGVGLGVGGAAAALPFIARHESQLPGAVHVNALHAVGVAVLAVFLGLCSALFPARTVARREIMVTLTGRRSAGARRRRSRVAGVCWGLGLAGLGLVGEYFGHRIAPDDGALLITGGIALIEVGAILCTPAIVAGLASLGRALPLGPRLALRDGVRHSGRTTPAVAAMFAAVAGAVAAGAWFESSAAQQRSQYTPLLRPNQIAVQLDAPDIPRVLSVLRPALPGMTGSVTTESVAGFGDPTGAPSQWATALFTPGMAPGCATASTKVSNTALGSGECDEFFGWSALENELIGDAQTLREVTGVDDATADHVLAEGGIVVTAPWPAIRNGEIGLVVQHTVAPSKADKGSQSTATYMLPAVYLDVRGKPNPGFVISAAAAHKAGLDQPAGEQTTLLIDLAKPATAQQLAQANEALRSLHLSGDFQKDTGVIEGRTAANLIVLAFTVLLAFAAAAIATGLALTDGRADQETLTAVGGSPWTRRWLAGSTALVITGMGVLIGVPIGFVIAVGLVRVGDAQNTFGPPLPFIFPWLNLGAMAVAVPVLTAAGAMLLSRSRASGRRMRLE